MKDRIILHIDMNSYFASVEQQANPFLRGRSVAVCSYLSENSVIIASSLEAKKRGIKTGCRVFEAKKLDSDVVLIENEPAKYKETSGQIFEILKKYSDKVEAYSIDEAFLDLSGWVSDFKDAHRLALQMQNDIKKNVGEWLNSSVGIAPTKFLAKFAGDIAPKKSVFLLSKSNLDNVLKDRPLKDAWGINTATEKKLHLLNIKNLLELKKSNPDKLYRHMGRSGYYLWANLNGLEISGVSGAGREAKSIGHSFSPKTAGLRKKEIYQIFYKLSEKTGRRLRASGLEAGGISVSISFYSGRSIGQSFKTAEKIFSSKEIFFHIKNFLEKNDYSSSPKTLSISLNRLSPVSGQVDFFGKKEGERKLLAAIDGINDKYGEYTLYSGSMFGSDEYAPERIGFRKTAGL